MAWRNSHGIAKEWDGWLDQVNPIVCREYTPQQGDFMTSDRETARGEALTAAIPLNRTMLTTSHNSGGGTRRGMNVRVLLNARDWSRSRWRARTLSAPPSWLHFEADTHGYDADSTRRPALSDVSVQTRFMVMPRTLPLSEVKAKLSEIVDGIVTTQERVTVTRNGRPVAVLLSTDDLEAIEETMAILSDPAAMLQIEQGRAAIGRGDVATKDEIEALRSKLRSKPA